MATIFYDAEAVDDSLVAASVAAAGPGPHEHVVQADAVWLARSVQPTRVPSRRSEEFRRGLMDVIDAEIARIGALRVRGVDVLEVARYEWLEALSHSAYQTWVMERLGTVHYVGGSSAAPVSRIAGVRREAGAAFRLLMPRGSGAHAARVLFVEHYPAGARVSAAVASRLAVSCRFLVTDPAAISARDDAELASVAASRRARVRALWHSFRVARRASRMFKDPVARQAVSRVWRRAATNITLFDEVTQRMRPSVVATSSYTGSFARAAVLTGRAVSVYLQHGILFHYNYGTHLVHDHYVVWGSRDRAGLVERGVSPEAITVVGSPTFEHLASVVHAPRAPRTPRPHEGLEVLYLPSRTAGGMVSAGMAASMLDAVVGAVRGLHGARLTVKVHPRDKAPLFDALHGTDVRVVRDMDPIEAILAADVVVSATSTVGIEACALDRPSVILAFPGVEVPAAYEEFGAVVLAHDADETAQAVGQAATDEAVRQRLAAGRRRMIDEMFAGLEPGALDRAAEVVRRLATSS